jgi:hypothetical protein
MPGRGWPRDFHGQARVTRICGKSRKSRHFVTLSPHIPLRAPVRTPLWAERPARTRVRMGLWVGRRARTRVRWRLRDGRSGDFLPRIDVNRRGWGGIQQAGMAGSRDMGDRLHPGQRAKLNVRQVPRVRQVRRAPQVPRARRGQRRRDAVR